MGFHKHGRYSFTVKVARMSVVDGNNFVADLTALRRHEASGAAVPLDVPVIAEQYGETATDAEGLAIEAICDWLDGHAQTLEQIIPSSSPESSSVNSA